MSRLLTILLLFAGTYSQPGTAQNFMYQAKSIQQMVSSSHDVFVPISKYLRQGNTEKLSAWFAKNLELDILGNSNDCSKVQATQIIKEFFTTYPPKNFVIIHKSGQAPLKYAIGTLNAGDEKFRVTLFVKTQSPGNLIQQLRIEKGGD